jgi:hypothetical protein
LDESAKAAGSHDVAEKQWDGWLSRDGSTDRDGNIDVVILNAVKDLLLSLLFFLSFP